MGTQTKNGDIQGVGSEQWRFSQKERNVTQWGREEKLAANVNKTHINIYIYILARWDVRGE